MSKCFFALLLLCVVTANPTRAQNHVQGPRSVSADSIEITLSEVRLRVAGPETKMNETLTPSLEPPGGKEAKIWFTLGFMLDSCRVTEMRRVDSPHPSTGSTLHDITFRCHYKASEFRTALQDMLE